MPATVFSSRVVDYSTYKHHFSSQRSWWYDVMNKSLLGSATWNCCSFPIISSFQIVSKVRCWKVLSKVKRVTDGDSAVHWTRFEIISLFNKWCCWLYNALINCRNDRNTNICLVLLQVIKVKLLTLLNLYFQLKCISKIMGRI